MSKRKNPNFQSNVKKQNRSGNFDRQNQNSSGQENIPQKHAQKSLQYMELDANLQNRDNQQIPSDLSESAQSLRSFTVQQSVQHDQFFVQSSFDTNQMKNNSSNGNRFVDRNQQEIGQENQLQVESSEESKLFQGFKIVQIGMDDVRLYNSKWITRLCQMERNAKYQPNNQIQKKPQDTSKSQIRKFKKIYHLKTKLKFPSQFEQLVSGKKQIKFQANPSIKITKINLQNLLLPQNIQTFKQLKLESFSLLIEYHTENSQMQKFLNEPADQNNYSIQKYSTNHFLSLQQVKKIYKNFPLFQQYVLSKSINDLFFVRPFCVNQIFCHQQRNCQKVHQQNFQHNHSKNQQITLLQKIICLRKFFKCVQEKTILNKSKIIRQTSQKQSLMVQQKISNKQSNFEAQKQLYGNNQLLQELRILYSQQKTQIQDNQVIQNKFNHCSSEQNLKFVQFVPKFNINEINYPKFVKQVSQVKKTYFNGISVGFKGFRISNFTTRSENNITFVFQDFHQLVELQSLLIDFQFPLNYIEQIKKQYAQFPNKKLKKIKIKFHASDKFKKANQSNGYYEETEKKLNTTQNSYLKNTSLLQMNQKPDVTSNRLMNSTMVNSSFFLQPSGYYQNMQQKSTLKEYVKEFYFYKLQKDSPDYERLIKHINSLSSVSKTLIMKFQCLFPLIHLKDSLSQLINICAQFSPIQMLLLPQPLQMLNIHDDYKSSLVTLKQQVRQLLENEEKFGCLGITRSGTKIQPQKLNAVNCFNMVKVHEEFLSKREMFKKIEKDFSHYNKKDDPIYNSQFEQTASSIELLLPHPKMKNEFICFPFHQKICKIVKYYQPETFNLLDLQLKQTNQRSQNFLPVEEITLNQHKTKMIKQGLDFFYFSYPFGEKFKISLQNHKIYTFQLKNQLKFNKLDHLRVLFWLAKINRIQNKVVFYQNSLSKPYLSDEDKKQYFTKIFIKQKLPSFDCIYEFGFVDEDLKSKIVQIDVYSEGQNKQMNKKQNYVFKKTIQKFVLEGQSFSKAQRVESYRIKTNRATWDMILKKLQQICNQKQSQLRKLTVSEEDDKQFQRLKKTLKKTNY